MEDSRSHLPPCVHGEVAPGYEPVAEAFARNLLERGDAGAAFAACVDDRLVVDVWGGVADAAGGRPWRRDTLAGIYSGTKGFVAACLLLLLERGALDLDAPVCAYWPEFAAEGKDAILVRHLVSHQAGLPGLATPIDATEAGDGERIARLLAAQPALHPPGERVVYHALTFGWLCGELIRRVDGRSVGRLFHEEIAAPLALDAWIGLPASEEERVAALVPGAGFGAQPRDERAQRGRDPVAWSIWSNPPRFGVDPLPANTRAWRAAEIPATNGIADARSIARLYGCLARGGELDGVRLFAPETIARGATRLAEGVDPYLDMPLAFGLGFGLQTELAPFGTAPDAFGHRGSGGSVHGAWPARRAGFSYVTSTLREGAASEPDLRGASLLDALARAVRA